MQEHRSEPWYVIQGSETLIKGSQNLDLYPAESIVIAKKDTHRAQNFGYEVLEIIEIQAATYLGEDYINRFEDMYGKKDFH
tara:strand:+ start:77 stop:319 length:243 start_codon:yes stop_codon:yes gene_type:complete